VIQPQFLHYVGEKAIAVSCQEGDDSSSKSLPLPNDFNGHLNEYTVRDEEVFHIDAIPNSLKRIAVISDYGINCGIATYTKYLCDELKLASAEVKIFAEHKENEDAEDDSNNNVIRCWLRSKDYSKIVDAIDPFNPDLIIIQHEYGLFHLVDQFCALMSQLSRWRTVVTLHTVLEHDVEPTDMRLSYLTRALTEAACREVIVHNPRARQTLRGRGFSGTIHYIPHGCFEPKNLPQLPATKYGMFPEHSLFQYGFGGNHKGWETALDIVEKLKEKYPNVFYIGLFNVSSFSEERSHSYYSKLLDLIKSRRLDQNVAIIRGFQSEEMISNFLRSTKACLFMYKSQNKHWASWGASGAIQQPISHGCPMILSDFSAFQELESRLPLCPDVDSAVSLIDRIFSDKEFEKEMREKSLNLARERVWSNIASWYLSCLPQQEFNPPCA
jgi:glycosyltransferase involved in cell wall biosynthesis